MRLPSDFNNFYLDSNSQEIIDNLSSEIYYYVAGKNNSSLLNCLKNVRFWDKNHKNYLGIIGIDHKYLWIFIESSLKNKPIIRLDSNFRGTIDLLYAFCRLIPDDILDPDHPFGRCPQCNTPLWLTRNHFNKQATVYCAKSTCQYTRKVTKEDAAKLVRIQKIKCSNESCQGQAIPRQNSSHQIFIGCSEYPRCQWSTKLEDYI